jgi:gamma-glutamylcyclotransferase (GGCT)/AIG2-like uncharacterized protein YtfP
MHIVFVYGTLKRAHGNHSLIAQGGGRDLGDAITVPKFFLGGGHGIPVAYFKAHPSRQMLPVRGELYKVDAHTLARLDRLEGHPDMYRRVLTMVRHVAEGGPESPAFIYTMKEAYAGMEPCPIIDGAYVWGRDRL